MALPTFVRNLILARQRAVLPQRLGRKRIYILPTRSGFVFGFFLLAMLVAAINYTNNLAFLLTFLLGSIAVISAIHAYANLAGLELDGARVLPTYRGEEARVYLVLRSGGRLRPALRVRVGVCGRDLSLDADERRELELGVPTVRRGLMPLPTVVVSTRFPLGLFRCWSPNILPVSGLVYPEPIPTDLRESGAVQAGTQEQPGAGLGLAGEFGGIRPHRPEDGLSRVSWKASARGVGLFAKEFVSGLGSILMLDWDLVRAASYEERIGRLAGLIREAERGGLSYGLRLPGRDIAVGSGPAHAHACLEALALLPEEG